MAATLELRDVVLPDDRVVSIQIDRGSGKIAGISPFPMFSLGISEIFEGNRRVKAAPGILDPHIHDRDPGNPRAETPVTLTRGALRGGVTGVAKMPNTNPPMDTIERLELDIARIGQQPITYTRWFGARENNLGEIRQLVHYLAHILGVKLYMAETTGGLIVRNHRDLYAICELCASLGIRVAVHAEDQDLIDRNTRNLGRMERLSQHCIVRDTEVEVSGIKLALQLLADTGCMMHICHVSTPEGWQRIYDAKQAGLPVTAETCMQYVIGDSTWLDRSDGWRHKCNPAKRTAQQVVRMEELLCADEGEHKDFIDYVASDHAGHVADPDGKLNPDPAKVPSGSTGIQTLGPSMFDLVCRGKMSMNRFVYLTSGRAAAIHGFTNKGWIGEGADADLVLLNPDMTTTFRDEDMESACKWTPLNGKTVQGGIPAVVAGGVMYRF